MSENQLKTNSKTFWLKNKNLGVAIFVAVLAIAIVGGLIIFNIFKPKESSSQTNTETNSSQNSSNIDSAQDQPTTSTPSNQDKPTNPTPPVITNLPVK
jgi:cytoskeletal protein RodZ